MRLEHTKAPYGLVVPIHDGSKVQAAAKTIAKFFLQADMDVIVDPRKKGDGGGMLYVYLKQD